MITNYLKELLNDNECVIIPAFGAFISKRHSATIDYANNRFMPPYKEIVFNNKLNNGDELLADFISQKENISKEESLAKIQNFVNQASAILDVNNEFVMEGLGKIRKFGDDCIFEMGNAENLLGDSFGLTEFNYQPVFRTETYQIIKERIVVEQKEKNTDYTIAIESVEETSTVSAPRRKPTFFRTLAYTTLAFFLLFVLNWTTDKSGSNLASWNPFLYSSPNEFFVNILSHETMTEEVVEIAEEVKEVAMEEDICVEEFETVETTEEIAVAEESVEISSEEVVTEETAEAQLEIVPETQVEVPSETFNSSVPQFLNSYYIVGGSFQTEASAERCLNSIKEQGFENASTLDKNDKGYIRVYYESFADKADALVRLDEIKSKYNASAWLLFQK